MRITSWLKSWNRRRQRLSVNASPAMPVIAEQLETRSLLSVSVLLIGGQLDITSDANDSIRVSSVSGNLLVETAAAGDTLLPFSGLPSTPTSSITSITITGGDEENSIDLGSVLAADFTSLTNISVQAGNGADTLLGSPDFNDNLQGEDGDDNINDQGGDNTLDGGDGRDVIRAGAGIDLILGGDGSDDIDGGAGNDSIDAGNGGDTIRAGLGDDSVYAGNGEDSIFGGDGNDTLNGDGGTDTVDGELGNDSILGGEFNDSLLGGEGNDTINGQAGRDFIDGQAGDDSVLGGAGNDSVLGNTGNDFVNGGAGNDTLEGGLGNDRVLGGANNDTLFDDDQNGLSDPDSADTLSGQSGDDTLFATSGADLLDGGIGNDLVDNRITSVSVNDTRLDPEGSTGTTDMVFTLTLSSALTRAVTVSYSTSNGTATTTVGGTSPQDNEDYIPLTASVTFAPGEVTKSVSVQIVGDTFDESDEETLFLNLTGATNASILDGLGEGRIVDDDAGSSGPIDVFLLLDDTSSFQFSGPDIIAAFPQIIANLQARFPGVSLGFGVGRFEEYRGTGNDQTPFVLNQPIIIDSTPNFTPAINAALARLAPSSGSGSDETVFEALRQIATGSGFVGNGDGDTTDNGPAGLVSTQLVGGGTTGDVPAYSTFLPDPSGPVLPPTIPVASSTDGVGFRPGAQHIVVMASDAFGWDFAPDGVDPYVGVGGVTVPASDLTMNATLSGTVGAAQIQTTINQLIAQGIQVITLAPQFTVSIGQTPAYAGISQLTGAVNQTTGPLENNITPGPSADDIQPGEPLFFQMPANNATLLATTISDAISGAAVAPLPPPPPPPPPPPAATGPQEDTIFGGDGDDTVLSGEFDDLINGGAGNDSLHGGDGNDNIVGGSGADTINGDAGDDTLNGQGGTDVLEGGAGTDSFVWEGAASGNDTLTDASGDNALEVRGSAASNVFDVTVVDDKVRIAEGSRSVTVGRTFNTLTINAGAGDDTVNVGDLSLTLGVVLTINGEAGDDLLSAVNNPIGDVRLSMDGGNGNDSLYGGSGDETLRGGTGSDFAHGGAGNDTISGGSGNDLLVGSTGDDSISGDSGFDSIRGNEGDDVLNGGADDDTLDGGTDDDTLNGDAGDDNLVGDFGNDSVLGGTGLDAIFGNDGDDTLDGGRNDDVITGGTGNDKIRGNHGNDSITGDEGADTINGGDGNDTVFGGIGSDALNGGDGDDIVNGNADSDTIVGGDGQDTLRGGGGNDAILGQDGDDNIDGQSGVDTVAGNQGADTLNDPVAEIDESFTLSAELFTTLEAA